MTGADEGIPSDLNSIETRYCSLSILRRGILSNSAVSSECCISITEVSTETSALAARGDTEDEKKSSKTVAVQLSTEEVVGSAITLFLAGYETTSTALGLIVHCLGKYPDVQRRLREEIEEALEGKEEPTYEVAMNLKYMDRVVRETMRLLPPVTG